MGLQFVISLFIGRETIFITTEMDLMQMILFILYLGIYYNFAFFSFRKDLKIEKVYY